MSALLRLVFCILAVSFTTARADDPPKMEIPKSLVPAADVDPGKKLAELEKSGKSLADFLRTEEGLRWLAANAIALADDTVNPTAETKRFRKEREAVLPVLADLGKTDPFFQSAHDLIHCL